MKQIHVSSLSKLALMLILLLSISLSFAQFAGGTGTEADPYQIESATHLDNIRNYMGAVFRLTADIDLNVAPYNLEDGWEPIGSYISTTENTPFTGKVYGDGFTISNLYINRLAGDYQALFGYASNATIGNLQVFNTNIHAHNTVAGLLGYGSYTYLLNCQVTGNITADHYAGGLVGSASHSTLYVCSSSGNITSSGAAGGLVGKAAYTSITSCTTGRLVTGNGDVGGLVGFNAYSPISYSYSTAIVTGNAKGTGGLVGSDFNSVIEFSYAIGNVTGGFDVGGLGGHMDYTQINSCFARGNVTGISIVGGLVGDDCINTAITNSYASGFITAASNFGGMAGHHLSGNVTSNSYWDMVASGQPLSAAGEGRTTDQMTYPYADNTYVGWDFFATWQADVSGAVNSGYPYLLHMPVTANEDEGTISIPAVTMNNYPNPFSSNTNITFNLPKASRISLIIYNLKGQKVRTIAEDYFSKGSQNLTWNGKSDDGKQVPCGMYIYKLKGTGIDLTRKLTLMK